MNMRLGVFAFLLCVCMPSSQASINVEWRSETAATRRHFHEVPLTALNGVSAGFKGNILLRGTLGARLPTAVGVGTSCSNNETQRGGPQSTTLAPDDFCLEFGDFAKLIHTFSINSGEELNCSRVEWSSSHSRKLEDCFDLQDAHWYGGGTLYNQTWPLEKIDREEVPFVTGDYTSTLTGALYGGIIENYFLLSTGVAIHVDEDIPLFVRWSASENRICLVSKDEHPHDKKKTSLTLKYDVCIGKNVRETHVKTLRRYYELPSGTPDEAMMLRPFWSTWNEFNAGVNESVVLEHARRILDEGFVDNSHFEIDDGWEASYGQNEFDPIKFPDPAGMVRSLKEMGFKVTLWTHPFINFDSPIFSETLEKGYLLKDPRGKTAITSWWHGDAGVLDFTNQEAVEWWTSRLERLRNEIGIDSFKFDAGEVDRLPHSFSVNESIPLAFHPNSFSKAYVEAVSSFGGMIEVRTGWRNQNLPIFYRMLDKGSRWGYDNGLQSLIPSLLQFGILGYPFVLPDMIGGNNYKPSPELWVRWMQANTFMPAVQFSIVPWSYDEEWVSASAKEMLALRARNADLILKAVNQSLETGAPINRPMWYVDGEDPETFTVDDQYMLGDDLMVCPVVQEGARSRSIYFPKGSWMSPEGEVITGPSRVDNYPADLMVLPYFFRVLRQEGEIDSV